MTPIHKMPKNKYYLQLGLKIKELNAIYEKDKNYSFIIKKHFQRLH